ncbi:unnamed protein product [Calypogeia fissa]
MIEGEREGGFNLDLDIDGGGEMTAVRTPDHLHQETDINIGIETRDIPGEMVPLLPSWRVLGHKRRCLVCAADVDVL